MNATKTVKLATNQSVFSLSFSADGRTWQRSNKGKGIKLWEPARDEITFVAIPTIAGAGALLLGRRPLPGGEYGR